MSQSSKAGSVRLIPLALVVALAASAQAQTTWKGLHFGDSRDRVRSTLAGQGIDVAVSQEGSLESITDYQLLLPGLTRTLPLRADFRFTDAGGLMDVTLWLDVIAMKQNYAELATDDALIGFASDRLERALTDIYGSPLSTSAGCDPPAPAPTPATGAAAPPAPRPPAVCTINWHSPGQSVALDHLTRTPHLFIRYQMLAPDL
jgi:hypothetical protein